MLLCLLPLANRSAPQILRIFRRFFMAEIVFSSWQNWTNVFIHSFISSYPFSSTRKNTSSQRAFGEPSSLSHFTSNPQEALAEKSRSFLNFCSQQLNLIYNKYGFIILVVYSTLPITYFSSLLPSQPPTSSAIFSISFLVHEPAALLFS